jgi:hypothetical protein
VTPQTVIRLGAGAAVLGGGLRVIAAFIPYTPESLALETLYAVIDLTLLFGLTAIYANESQHLGWPGLAAFVVAFSGLASIVGPDAAAFGVDWYQAGAGVTALGLALFGAILLTTRRLILPALCWLAVPVVALIVPAPIAFQAAGALLGAGFVAAGLAWFTPPAAGID